tara:strand:+ start:12 stop:503 length:492 start_codon:yes stop_codon:yes gene_type:complete
MKKLLGIIVLGLWLSGNAYAEVLKLKCTYKYVDEKSPNFKVGDSIFYDYDLNSKGYVITDDYIRFYLVSKFKDSHYVTFNEIYRYSGEQISKSAEIPKEEIEELLKLNIYKQQIFEQNEKTFYKIKILTNKWFFKNKHSPLDYMKKPMWLEHRLDCEKAKKQF